MLCFQRQFVFTLLFTVALLLSGQLSHADDALESAKRKVFEQYGIIEAKSGDYPVQIFSRDQVPLPAPETTFKWLDNETIMYVQDSGRRIGVVEGFKNPGSFSLISVNLNTFEKIDLYKLSSVKFCYDYETKNIQFRGAVNEGTDKKVTYAYGKLGEELKNYRSPPEAKTITEKPYINPLDCTFHEKYPPTLKGLGQRLRKDDGSIYVFEKKANDFYAPTTYIWERPDDSEKKFVMGNSTYPSFHYDYFSQLYWQSETLPNKNLKVWRLDQKRDIVLEETYPKGPWGEGGHISILSHSVKPGFLVGGRIWANGRPYELVYLITSKQKIINLPDMATVRAISPDGCKAFGIFYVDYTRNLGEGLGESGVIDLCKTPEYRRKS